MTAHILHSDDTTKKYGSEIISRSSFIPLINISKPFYMKNALHFCQTPKKNIMFNHTWNTKHFEVRNYIEIGGDDDALSNTPGNYKSCTFTMQYQLLCLRNVLFRANNVYMFPGTNVVYYLDWLSRVSTGHNVSASRVVDKFVAVANSHNDGFGDCILGSISRLTMFPKEILEGSTIGFQNSGLKHYIDEVLEIMGIKEIKYIWVSYYDFIFVKELYLFQPNLYDSYQPTECLHSFYGYILDHLGELIREKAGVQDISPTLYALMFREKGMMRYIANTDECEQAIKRQHPDINFVRINHSYNSLVGSARMMSQVKWMFAPSGSNIMHCIFMNRNTYVCTFIGSWFDYPVTSTLATRGIYTVCFRNTSWINTSREPIQMPIERFLKYIKRSIMVCKGGGFDGIPKEL